MDTWQVLSSTWHFEPSVVFGCGLLLLGYVVYLSQKRDMYDASTMPHALPFLAGVLILLFSLTSPLDTLGDTYLFSAHMLQHLLLVLVVPPLLLLGLPAPGGQKTGYGGQGRGGQFKIQNSKFKAPVAWALGVGTLWVWHLPALFDATLRHEGLHIFEHLCFLASATLFWWPTLGPGRARWARSLTPVAAMVYLFAASLTNDLLGILITFAPVGLYPPYLHPVDGLRILPLLRDGWGLTPAADQQVAGLLMWIPGNLGYLVAIFAQLARWYGESDADSLPLAPRMEEV